MASIAADATPPPPRNTRSNPSAKSAVARLEAAKDATRQTRLDGLNSIASGIHMALLAGRMPADAGAVNRHAPAINSAIVDFADSNSAWGEKLDKLSDVSPAAGIAMAAIPLLLQVAVNHNLFGMKAEQLATAGVVTKETLAAESNTYLMAMQRQAMEREMEESRGLREAQRKWAEFQREEAASKASANDADL